jgi:hypothetical protein
VEGHPGDAEVSMRVTLGDQTAAIEALPGPPKPNQAANADEKADAA